jgi:catechol 2,3-dioxygenase-like lactoylglutathione lyase family enzyme
VVGERLYPILPCADLDELLAFYEALGFRCTFRQRRPNPYAVVAREDIQIHFSGIEGFDPSQSYGSTIIAVPDADALYERFAQGLRAGYGKLPSSGIPRILRPRKKAGTVSGFSVVDPGGNWLRVYRLGDSEDDANAQRSTGLARVIDNAARRADAQGDDRAGRTLLANGLTKFADAPLDVRARAFAYLAELEVRLGDASGAQAALESARSLAIEFEPAPDHALTAELAHACEVVRVIGDDPATPPGQ